MRILVVVAAALGSGAHLVIKRLMVSHPAEFMASLSSLSFSISKLSFNKRGNNTVIDFPKRLNYEPNYYTQN